MKLLERIGVLEGRDKQPSKIDPPLRMSNSGLWLRLVNQNGGLRKEHVDLLMAEYLSSEELTVAELWLRVGLDEKKVKDDKVFTHYSFNYESGVLPSQAAIKDVYSHCSFGSIQRELISYKVDPEDGNFGYEVLEKFVPTLIGIAMDDVSYKLFSHTIEHNRRLFSRPHIILASPGYLQTPSIRWLAAS